MLLSLIIPPRQANIHVPSFFTRRTAPKETTKHETRPLLLTNHQLLRAHTTTRKTNQQATSANADLQYVLSRPITSGSRLGLSSVGEAAGGKDLEPPSAAGIPASYATSQGSYFGTFTGTKL